MRDMVPEQQIHPLGVYRSADYDYDYDVLYFEPSVVPYIVSPEDFEVLDHLQGPSLNRWAFQVNDDLPRRPISPALSFSYSITSDFMFPDVASEASLEGYSRLFRAGLTSVALSRIIFEKHSALRNANYRPGSVEHSHMLEQPAPYFPLLNAENNALSSLYFVIDIVFGLFKCL